MVNWKVPSKNTVLESCHSTATHEQVISEDDYKHI
jgi:hypothetical protein